MIVWRRRITDLAITVRRPAHETASLACGLEFPFVEQLRFAGEEQGIGN